MKKPSDPIKGFVFIITHIITEREAGRLTEKPENPKTQGRLCMALLIGSVL